MATQSPPLLKVSVLHYRDQSHDEETWIKWWKEEHMPAIIPIALKHGIERVELVRSLMLPRYLPQMYLVLTCDCFSIA
jgi:hypothetical protein